LPCRCCWRPGFRLRLNTGAHAWAASSTPAVTFTGIVRGFDSKLLNIEGPETNTLVFHCSKKTKYFDGDKEIKKDVIKTDAHVSVEAKRAGDGSMDALNVRLEHPKTEEATQGER
jgi:hypothetical protein